MPLQIKREVKQFREETNNATRVYEYTWSSVSSLLASYETARPQGAPSNQEQDLLRAMLVMAGAGLDATVKQLLKASLTPMIENTEAARDGFTRFITRCLGEKAEAAMAKAIATGNVSVHFQERYIRHLTGDSVQSVEQLHIAAKALSIDSVMKSVEPSHLRAAFEVRNKIVHELDLNFSSPGAGRRTQTLRRKNDMVNHAENLLKISKSFIEHVDNALQT